MQPGEEKDMSWYQIVVEDGGFRERIGNLPLIQQAHSSYEIYELICIGQTFKEDWATELKAHRKAIADRYKVVDWQQLAEGSFFARCIETPDPNYTGPAVEACPFLEVTTPDYKSIKNGDWDMTRHPACRLAHLCGFKVYGARPGETFDLDKTLAEADMNKLYALSRTMTVTGEVFQIACGLAPFHIRKLKHTPTTKYLLQRVLSNKHVTAADPEEIATDWTGSSSSSSSASSASASASSSSASASSSAVSMSVSEAVAATFGPLMVVQIDYDCQYRRHNGPSIEPNKRRRLLTAAQYRRHNSPSIERRRLRTVAAVAIAVFVKDTEQQIKFYTLYWFL